MEKKITKADKFRKLLTFSQVAEDAESVEFINHELELLAKKSASKKPAKQSEEFLALKDTVRDALSDDVAMTISEVIKASDALTGMNTQKIVPVIKALIADGEVERIEEKGKALFIKK